MIFVDPADTVYHRRNHLDVATLGSSRTKAKLAMQAIPHMPLKTKQQQTNKNPLFNNTHILEKPRNYYAQPST